MGETVSNYDMPRHATLLALIQYSFANQATEPHRTDGLLLWLA
jgi:hypothetical protein